MKPIVSDRRRFPRAPSFGLVATVRARNSQTAQFEVEDLSAGGARLVGALLLADGEHVQVLIGRTGARPLVLMARVVRVLPPEEIGRHVVAVSFSKVPDPVQDAIQELVVRVLERQRDGRRPTVLVIDDIDEICKALTRDVRSLGYVAVAVRTPLDAVRCLQDPTIEVETAIVDLGLGRADGLDVIRHLAEEHPQVRRVVMSGNHVDDLQCEVARGRAHAYVVKPWDLNTLNEALRR